MARSRAPFVVVAVLVSSGAGVAAYGRLTSCAAHDEHDLDAGAPDAALAEDAASERRTTPTAADAGAFDPCSRTDRVRLDGGEAGVAVVLPCRPYDPVVDPPDPQPK